MTTVVPMMLAAMGAWVVEQQQARDEHGSDGSGGGDGDTSRRRMCPCFPAVGGSGGGGGRGGEYAALRMDGVGEGQPGDETQPQVKKGVRRAP